MRSQQVHSWFVNFIGDEEVLHSTRIDIEVMGKIVAQTGAAITSFATLWYKKELHEKTLIDIGVLRFPDVKNPFFKVSGIMASSTVTFRSIHATSICAGIPHQAHCMVTVKASNFGTER